MMTARLPHQFLPAGRAQAFRRLRGVGLALALLCQAAAADLRVEVSESVNDAEPVAVTHWFGGDRSVRDDGGRYIITRLDLQEAYVVDRGKRSYKVIPMALEAGSPPPAVTVSPTEDYRQIGEWNARRYRLGGPATRGLTIDVWIARDIEADISQFRQLMVQLSQRKGSEWLRAYEEIDGFPVLQQVELERRGISLHTESRVTSIADVKPEQGLYQPPEDFRQLR